MGSKNKLSAIIEKMDDAIEEEQVPSDKTNLFECGFENDSI